MKKTREDFKNPIEESLFNLQFFNPISTCQNFVRAAKDGEFLQKALRSNRKKSSNKADISKV